MKRCKYFLLLIGFLILADGMWMTEAWAGADGGQEMSEGNEEITKIHDSPFQYQLLNSEVMPIIEEKLGRSFTVNDIFYECETTQSLLKDETYIYNKENNLLIKVDLTKLKRTRAMYYWVNGVDYIFDEGERAQLLDTLVADGFNTLYVCFDRKTIADLSCRAFIRACYEKGISVEFLTANNYAIAPKNREEVLSRINLVADYNSAVSYDEKLAGVHFDIEVYLSHSISLNDERTEWMDPWVKSNGEEHLDNQRRVYFLEYVQLAKERAEALKDKLLISYDVAASMIGYDVRYQGKRVNFIEEIVKQADYITIMSYQDRGANVYSWFMYPTGVEYWRDYTLIYTAGMKAFPDGTMKNTSTYYELMKKYRKSVVLGAETKDVGNSNTTYFEEGKAFMNQQLKILENMLLYPTYDDPGSLKGKAVSKLGLSRPFPFNHYSLAVHALDDYVKLKP